MMLGQVDDVDGHYIATRFVGLCIPISSMYVTESSSSRSGNVSTMRWAGVPVKLNAKSALLAYPRVWLWVVAFAWPFVTHYGENVNSLPRSTWWTMGAFVAVAIASNFVGGLSKTEKERLRVLGRVTGMRLDPSKLIGWKREDRREFWDKELTKLGITTTPQGVLAASEGAPPDVLGVLYTFACYSGDGPDWRGPAAQIYARITSSKTA